MITIKELTIPQEYNQLTIKSLKKLIEFEDHIDA